MKICSIEECGKKVIGNGYCSMHYSRIRRTGTTDFKPRQKGKIKYTIESETNKIYDTWQIIKFFPVFRDNGKRTPPKVLVKCIRCNNDIIHETFHSSVIYGHYKNCICHKQILWEQYSILYTEHGYSNHPYYHICSGIFHRCNNPKAKSYKNYGGRGIKCFWTLEQIPEMITYLETLGEKPDGYSLDRINNDGNYEPGNLRWASRKEQAQNRGKQIRLIEYQALEKEINIIKNKLELFEPDQSILELNPV